jgi:hypothetical protein
MKRSGRFQRVLTAALIGLPLILSGAGVAAGIRSRNQGGGSVLKANEKLVIVWSSGDRDVALKMVFMYALNAKSKGWWKEVTLIVWGPSAKLLTVDPELQERVRRMKEAGVILEACKACSDEYGVSESLSKLGVDVRYMGQPLTGYLKGGRPILTF